MTEMPSGQGVTAPSVYRSSATNREAEPTDMENDFLVRPPIKALAGWSILIVAAFVLGGMEALFPFGLLVSADAPRMGALQVLALLVGWGLLWISPIVILRQAVRWAAEVADARQQNRTGLQVLALGGACSWIAFLILFSLGVRWVAASQGSDSSHLQTPNSSMAALDPSDDEQSQARPHESPSSNGAADIGRQGSLVLTAYVMNSNRQVLPTALASAYVYRATPEMVNFQANLHRLYDDFNVALEAYASADQEFRENYRDTGESGRRQGFNRQIAADLMDQGASLYAMKDGVLNEGYYVKRERAAKEFDAAFARVLAHLEGLQSEQGMQLLVGTGETNRDGVCHFPQLTAGTYFVLLSAAYGNEEVVWLEPIDINGKTELTLSNSNALIF